MRGIPQSEASPSLRGNGISPRRYPSIGSRGLQPAKDTECRPVFGRRSTPEKRLAESNPPGWPIRVSRIGNDFSIRAIDEDDHRFQRRLTEEHLVSEDESVFENFSVIDLDKHRAGDTNRNFAAVRERRSRSDYQISAMLKTNPGRTGSPLILVGFSKHSTGCPGR